MGRRHGVRLPPCAHGLERTFRAHAKKDPAARFYVARRKNRFTSKTQFLRLCFIRGTAEPALRGDEANPLPPECSVTFGEGSATRRGR